jgi:hypothetical protein
MVGTVVHVAEQMRALLDAGTAYTTENDAGMWGAETLSLFADAVCLA